VEEIDVSLSKESRQNTKDYAQSRQICNSAVVRRFQRGGANVNQGRETIITIVIWDKRSVITIIFSEVAIVTLGSVTAGIFSSTTASGGIAGGLSGSCGLKSSAFIRSR